MSKAPASFRLYEAASPQGVSTTAAATATTATANRSTAHSKGSAAVGPSMHPPRTEAIDFLSPSPNTVYLSPRKQKGKGLARPVRTRLGIAPFSCRLALFSPSSCSPALFSPSSCRPALFSPSSCFPVLCSPSSSRPALSLHRNWFVTAIALPRPADVNSARQTLPQGQADPPLSTALQAPTNAHTQWQPTGRQAAIAADANRRLLEALEMDGGLGEGEAQGEVDLRPIAGMRTVGAGRTHTTNAAPAPSGRPPRRPPTRASTSAGMGTGSRLIASLDDDRLSGVGSDAQSVDSGHVAPPPRYALLPPTPHLPDDGGTAGNRVVGEHGLGSARRSDEEAQLLAALDAAINGTTSEANEAHGAGEASTRVPTSSSPAAAAVADLRDHGSPANGSPAVASDAHNGSFTNGSPAMASDAYNGYFANGSPAMASDAGASVVGGVWRAVDPHDSSPNTFHSVPVKGAPAPAEGVGDGVPLHKPQQPPPATCNPS